MGYRKLAESVRETCLIHKQSLGHLPERLEGEILPKLGKIWLQVVEPEGTYWKARKLEWVRNISSMHAENVPNRFMQG